MIESATFPYDMLCQNPIDWGVQNGPITRVLPLTALFFVNLTQALQ